MRTMDAPPDLHEAPDLGGLRELRIVWVVHDDRPGLQTDPEVFCQHRSAGRRLRVGIPARWLQAAGARQWFLSPPSPEGLAEALALQPHIALISGLFPNVAEGRDPASYFDCLDAFHTAGTRIVVDFGENHFQDFRADEFRRMLLASDGLIINTSGLADIIEEETGRSAVVINDPVEGPRGEPGFNPPRRAGWLNRLASTRPRPLRLLWFGAQERNFHYLRLQVSALQALAQHLPLTLSVVTGPIDGMNAEMTAWNSVSPHFQARYSLWSMQTLSRELEACEVVIIPSDPAGRMAASANRMVESFQAGRIVVAHGVASYWRFHDLAWIGDIAEGVLWAANNPAAVRARIAAAQDIIAAEYAPDAVGPQWGRALLQYWRG